MCFFPTKMSSFIFYEKSYDLNYYLNYKMKNLIVFNNLKQETYKKSECKVKGIYKW